MKQIVVETCFDCPYHTHHSISTNEVSHNCDNKAVSSISSKRIWNENKTYETWTGKIPFWCPLSDYNTE